MKLVFLIGSGRSGTKFLRDTLFAATNVTRIPYDINYFWRYGNQKIIHDEISISNLSEKQKGWIKGNILRFVDKDTDKKNPDIVIEKTVANTFRVELLAELFPEAKFVHLIRDGREVTESAIRLWKQPPKVSYLRDKLRYYPFSELSYAFWFIKEQLKHLVSKEPPIWGTRYKGITEDVKRLPLHEVCAKQWALGVKSALNDFAELSKERYLEVKYTELVTDKDAIIQICDFIGIDKELVVNRWQHSVDPSNKVKWEESLDETVLNDIVDLFSKILPERPDLYNN